MWFIHQFEKWNLASHQWFMAHEEVAKIKCLPNEDEGPGKGKIILVTAMNPTPFGEGKTTTVIALSDALSKLGENTVATLRQPSVGPVFGKKGGATGGGKASVVPHDRIDLGLAGDFYAIENANNMMAALIDNHIYYHQEPHFADVLWKRCLDMNDRTLRSFNAAEGKRGFVITAASELMAILSLSRSFRELKEKIGNCIVAEDHHQNLIKAKDLNFHKAASVLLRDAFYPNLVKTMEGTPVIMHAGPFANIAQGTSSIVGTKMATHLADYVVTEAGFGAELGAEKFFNIKSRIGEFKTACVVLVATTRAIELHGIENLFIHIENLQKFGPSVVVCLNRFDGDTEEELKSIVSQIREKGVPCEIGEGFLKGSEGTLNLAKVVRENAHSTTIKHTYELSDGIQEKVEKVAKEIYRAGCVDWSVTAKEQIKKYKDFAHLPICMAKTPMTLTDNPKNEFTKEGHTLHIRDLKLQAGAGFIVPMTGDTRLLPGLPKLPRALDVDLSDDGEIIW